MSNFSALKEAVAKQFQRMQGHQLYRAEIDRDDLWATYLASFPAGTNLIYRERAEYDCSCCRHFVKTVGDVIAVVDGRLVSIWDVSIPAPEDATYQPVVDALSRLVLSKKSIAEPFLHYEPSAGTDKSFEQIDAVLGEHLGTDVKTTVRTWHHFFVNIDKKFVKPKTDIPTLISERRSQHDVFLRSLREITDEAVDTVLDLVSQGSLYRGEEHRGMVAQFKALKQEFALITDERLQDVFAWNVSAQNGAIARIRNSAIGTLLVDLSEDKDLESAVRSFEAKVAPTNYKRPSSLITKAMIEKAKEKLGELGLTSALERRFAVLTDISIENVLFADRATRRVLTGNPLDELLDATADIVSAKSLEKVEEVPIDRFIAEILPRAESIEVMFENRHQGNLVSLIAPVDPTA